MGIRVVRIDRVEVNGWKPPHELKIEFGGVIDAPVDDGFVVAAYKRRQEFLKAVGPTIEEAFERVFLRGAEAASQDGAEAASQDGASQADSASPPLRVIGVDLAAEPAVIEDIEL